jgi:penicillin G amidase
MDRERPGDSRSNAERRLARFPVLGPRRVVAALVCAVVLAALAAPTWLYRRMRASLPALDATAAVAGLGAPVTVERDALGVPTIRGASRLDVARATGFVHAQDRFFQMDLMRRRAAGELAELVGGAAVEWDRRIRIHRLRLVARESLARGTPSEKRLLGAYAEGVNAGLAALADKPFEYLLLRTSPAPWRAEDTVLVELSMFIQLTSWDGRHESNMGVLHDTLPSQMADFLAPPGTEWDAPDEGPAFAAPPVPGPEVFVLRRGAAAASAPRAIGVRPSRSEIPGSNSFAVAARRSAHGGAILANDMHLGLMVPNTWYRAVLAWPDPERPGRGVRVAGVTLPGTPAIVVGSNTHVAWGFTDSEGDWSDLVVIEVDPADPDAYLTPGGPRRFEHASEIIKVKGAKSETLDAVSTVWGPVIDKDHEGRPRALRWTGDSPEAVNFHLVGLENARTLDEALAVANRSGIPPQNFVCVTSDGHIAWTIAGVLPRRVGFDGRLPTSWRDGSRRWDGWVSPDEIPRIVDPPSGLLWTANARVIGGEALAKLGDGGYALGARAHQIRDDLRALPLTDERGMLAVQLDDRAVFLQRWRELLLATLTPQAVAADPRRAQLRELVEKWSGRAATDSVGYRIVRMYRDTLIEQVVDSLTAACRRADSRFRFGALTQAEGPVWQILVERPSHLLAPRFATWDDQLLAAADAVGAQLRALGDGIAAHTWGERNTAAIRHPLSPSLGLLGGFLDMPRDELPGDTNMPRVQSPSFGASERMVVSPGNEARGIFHMPCGQSGHPLSPFYRAGHRAWVLGSPTPFLPGPRAHLLTLVPAGAREGKR